jgi:hypothetical protein
MSYHCPACNKVSAAAQDLARHMIGRGDKVHRDWIRSRGFRYSELLAAQIKSFGNDGYKALVDLLEKETKAED